MRCVEVGHRSLLRSNDIRYATIRKPKLAVFVLAAMGGVGCSDVFGPSGSEDIRVTVDHFAEEDSLTLTIRNEGSDRIFYRPTCMADLEMRAGMTWVAGRAIPFGTPVYCTMQLVAPIPIQPSDVYRIERSDLGSWVHGEYRFKLDLRDEGKDMLPDNARESNTFRIEG